MPIDGRAAGEQMSDALFGRMQALTPRAGTDQVDQGTRRCRAQAERGQAAVVLGAQVVEPLEALADPLDRGVAESVQWSTQRLGGPQQEGQTEPLTQVGRRQAVGLDLDTIGQQGIDHVLVVLLGEEGRNRARHLRTDIRNRQQQNGIGVSDGVEIAEAAGQGLGGLFADLQDAEAEQQPLQRDAPSGIDGSDQLFRPAGGDLGRLAGLAALADAAVVIRRRCRQCRQCRQCRSIVIVIVIVIGIVIGIGIDRVLGRRVGRGFAGPGLALALHLQQVIHGQPEDVGNGGDPAEVDQILDHPFAQSLDVHRPTRGKVDQRLLALSRAVQAAGAASDRLAGFTGDGRATGWTVFRQGERGMQGQTLGIARSPLDIDRSDFRDNVAGPPHDHRVADPDIQPGDLVGVVQGGIGDRDPGDPNRRQSRDRGDRTGAADLDIDGLDRGGLLQRGVLVGQRPARRPRDEAEHLLLVVAIELVDDAVDVVRQCLARRPDAPVVIEQADQTTGAIDLGTDRQTERTERCQGFGMALRQRPALDLTQAVGEECQRPAGGDRRIELAQRAGRTVARVGQRLLATRQGLAVVALEGGTRHVDLAAHLQPGRSLAAQTQGNGPDRAQIGGHVLADPTIATGGTPDESTLFVDQADRQAIQFGFDREFRFRHVQGFGQPAHEGGGFLLVEGVGQ